MMAAFVVVAVVVGIVRLVVMRVTFVPVVMMLMLMRRSRCHLIVIRSEIGVRLGDVLEQFSQHAADVLVSGEIENLLAFALCPHDSRRPQQAQMVTHERSR